MSRPYGKLGCLPGKIPVGLHDLNYYVAGSLPAPPPSVAVPENSDWGMLGNDQKGNCGVAGIEHGFEVDATITQTTEQFPTAEQNIEYYLTYTDGRDSGVVLSDFLAYVRKTGFYGHTVSAYAPVAVHDIPTLQNAVSLFGFAYSGITVTEAMQQAFSEHQPWTTETLRSPVAGGHCVPCVGYDDHFLYVITWGGVQAISYSCWAQIATESWAVMTGEFVTANGDGRGISLSALTADLDRLAD